MPCSGVSLILAEEPRAEGRCHTIHPRLDLLEVAAQLLSGCETGVASQSFYIRVYMFKLYVCHYSMPVSGLCWKLISSGCQNWRVCPVSVSR